MLCEWREHAIQAAIAQISEGRAGEHNERVPPALAWYDTVNDWCSLKGRAPVLWRPQCSVITEVVARCGAVAVPFDPAAYTAWRGKRADTEVLRGAWAAARASSGK